MAASGIFRAFGGGGVYFEVVWEQVVYPSYSKIRYNLSVGSIVPIIGNTSKPVKVTIGDTSKDYSVKFNITTANTKQLIASGEEGGIIYHNADGTATVSLALEAYVGAEVLDTQVEWVRGSENVSLTPINIAAYIVQTSQLNDEDPFAIGYANPGANVKKIQLEIYIGNTLVHRTDDLPTAASNITAYTTALSSDSKELIRNTVVNSTVLPATVILRTTFADNTSNYNTFSTQCYVLAGPIVMNPTVEVIDGTSLDLTGSVDKIIKGVSNVAYAFNATADKNARITTYRVGWAGLAINEDPGKASGTILKVTNPKFIFAVQDSRGITASREITKDIVDYVPITCNLESEPAEFDGETSATIPFVITGQYYNGSFGARDNIIQISYRYQIDNDSYTSWRVVTPVLEGNTYRATVDVSLGYESKVAMEVSVLDQIGTAEASLTKSVSPIFDWSNDDFNFNVPVNINGAATVEGDATINGGITVTGDATIDGGATIGGYTPLCIVEHVRVVNGWEYIRYSNGVAECWKTVTLKSAISNATATGNWFSSGEKAATNMSYPFTFLNRPVLTVSVQPTGSSYCVIFPSNTTGSTTKTGSFQLMSTTSQTERDHVLSYYARGRWK